MSLNVMAATVVSVALGRNHPLWMFRRRSRVPFFQHSRYSHGRIPGFKLVSDVVV